MLTDDKPDIPQEPEVPVDKDICKNCGVNRRMDGDHPLQLCYDCRQSFIKFPIPMWIKAFAGGVLIVMIAGLWRMPKFLGASIHLARAEKAMEQHRYLTAQNELAKVLATFPGNVEVNAKMLIASANNYDVEIFSKVSKKLQDEMFQEGEQLDEMKAAALLVMKNFPQDTTLVNRMAAVKNDPDSLERIYASLKEDPDGLIAGFVAANYLYDMKQYKRCDSLLELILKDDPDFYAALGLKVATDRTLGKYDEAIAICDRLLEANREDVPVMAQKARVELKRKNDVAARKYADEAMAVNSDDITAMEAMAMCEHYAGKRNKANELLAGIKEREVAIGDSTISSRLSKLISGEQPYR